MIRVLTFGRYAEDNFGGLERYVFELTRGCSFIRHSTRASVCPCSKRWRAASQSLPRTRPHCLRSRATRQSRSIRMIVTPCATRCFG